MTDLVLGGFTVRSGNTGNGIYAYSTRTLGDARAGSDGTKPIVITALYGAASGYGGVARTGRMYLGSSYVDTTFAGSSSAQDTGWLDSVDWLTYAGTSVQYGYTSLSGRFYFARSTTSPPNGTFDTGAGFTGYLGMYYRFYEVCSAPSFTSITPNSDGDQVTIIVGQPVGFSNGGTAVTGYRIQRATNAAFTTGLATVDSTGTTVMTGLTPGAWYYYRVTARNYTSDTAGILGGAWSGTSSAAQPDNAGVGRYFNGTVFTAADGKRFNGSTWDQLAGKEFNGTTWDEIGT